MILNKTLGATLLVAGTCIGAGMLALPVSAAASGFYWSGALTVIVWLLMLFTGLMVVEVNVWLKGRASYISMAEKTLGQAGKIITWILFLFLLYALMSAYISGGAALVLSVMQPHFAKPLPLWFGLVPWVLVFGCMIYLGTTTVDVLNKLLVVGLVLSFVIMLVIIAPKVQWQPSELPAHHVYIFAALPIFLTSYGYHIIIPSVSRYLDHDATKLRKVVIVGSSLALVFYLIWEYLIFGIVPFAGEQGLQAILASGQPAATLTSAISFYSHNTMVAIVIDLFAFFALCSSFIGVALGLFHLLADGIKSDESIAGKLFVAILTFVPPILFALFYPRGFIMALAYAGVIVALIHGVLPALMVWFGRYRLNLSDDESYRVMGGKVVLAVAIVASLVVLAAVIAGDLGVIPQL